MGNKKGSKRQDNKGRILRELESRREGLTAEGLNTTLNLGKDIHTYLGRLLNDGLVEWLKQEGETYKSYGLTDKYFEPARQKEALEILDMIKDLVNRGAIKLDENKMNSDEIALLFQALKQLLFKKILTILFLLDLLD